MESDLPLVADSVEQEGQPTELRTNRSVVWNESDHIYHLAIVIIKLEFPLHIVEQNRFVDLVKGLQPQSERVSLTRIQKECESIYLDEKRNLLNFLGQVPGRVSLSLDIWTCTNIYGYAFLRGHFIDNSWNSHCRILNVVRIFSPEKWEHPLIDQAVITCLHDWQLNGRVFNLTVDQSGLLTDSTVKSLRDLLVANGPNFPSGQFVLLNCLARTLSRLAQDALSSMSEVVRKIRGNVMYLKASSDRWKKFHDLKHQLQVPNSCNDLPLDGGPRWDTTCHMLAAACELKEVFSCFYASDPGPDPRYNLTLLTNEWNQADSLCTHLKYFLDVANILASSSYPTASVFFLPVAKIQMELTRASMSLDPFAHDLTKPLKEKFDKYWRDSYLVLAIAAAMDPSFKLKHVELTFSEVCVEDAKDWTKIVEYTLHSLFLDYAMKTLAISEVLVGDVVMDFDGCSSDDQRTKSELDRYLEEQLVPRSQEFDVLSWWRENKYRYPNLSIMACDILSMPVSSVAHDSVFHTETRRFDSYRSSLPPAALEALICAKDWLEPGSPPEMSDYRCHCQKREF